MPEAYGRLGWRRGKGLLLAPAPTPAVEGEVAPEASSLVPKLTYTIVGLYALTFSVLSILQHDSFNTHAFDLGNMDQAVWNTAQGRWFHFTNWEGVSIRLAAHVEPILLLIAQFYHLYSSPKVLLVLQTVVISLGALPAFWLARDLLKNPFAALTFASAYLLLPDLEAANLADFHPVSLSASLLLYAFHSLYRERYLLFWLFALLAMGTKEQVPLSVVLMGLYIAFIQKRRALGLCTAAFALTWSLVAFWVVIPHFNPAGASPFLSRYDHLGGNAREILGNFVLHPGEVLATLSEPPKLEYVRHLFQPLVFLPLLSPFTLLFALPDLAINLLSNFPAMYSGRDHYGAVIVPYLVVSAILGTAWAVGRLSALAPWLGRGVLYLLCAGVLASSLSSYYQAVLLPLSDHLPRVTLHHRLAGRFLALIPPEAGVSAGTSLNPHVSQRQKLHLFPELGAADYVFLDVTASPYPNDVPSLNWRVDTLLREGGWGVLAAEDGYLLLQRGHPSRQLPEAFYTFALAENPTIQRSASVTFGNALRFLGYDLSPGEVLHGKDPYASATLYWEVLKPPGEDLLFALYIVGSGNRVLSVQAFHPTTTWLPTSRWQPGAIYRVEVARLPLGSAPWGDLQLGVVRGKDLQSPQARLKPTIEQTIPPYRLNPDGTLLRLTTLVAG